MYRTLFLLILLFCIPVHVCTAGTYSETVSAVLDRLGMPVEKVPGQETNQEYQETNVHAEQEHNHANENPVQEPTAKQEPDTVTIGPINKYDNKSVMERVLEEKTISLSDITDKADSAGTKFYNTITKIIIGLAPIILIVGAALMLFTKGKMVGFLVIFGLALFVILNAPELISVLINLLANVFR